MLSDLGRKDEAIAELRRSVKTLGELARANADTPRIQDIYLGISRNLADRLAKLNRPDEAVRAYWNRERLSTGFPERRRPTSLTLPVGMSPSLSDWVRSSRTSHPNRKPSAMNSSTAR